MIDTNLKEWFHENIKCVLLRKLEEFDQKDAQLEIPHLKGNINHCQSINVEIATSAELPARIKHKKAVLNIHNNDEYCFLVCRCCTIPLCEK